MPYILFASAFDVSNMQQKMFERNINKLRNQFSMEIIE